MNLNDFLVDPAKLAGVWWDFTTKAPCAGNAPHATHICFKVVPFGAAFDACWQQLLEPFLAERRRGVRLPAEQVRQLRGQALAREALRDWANLELGAPPAKVEYSADKAIELLTDPKWELVRRFVESAAANEASLLADAEQEAVPN